MTDEDILRMAREAREARPAHEPQPPEAAAGLEEAVLKAEA